jgi:hypothetical protein
MTLVFLSVLPVAALAINAGQRDTFQSGTVENWVEGLNGGLPPVPPAVIANAGPNGAGDFALRLTATGNAIGAGGKLVVNNIQARWIGSYSAAGVNGLMLDVRNPNTFPLTVRVGVDGPALGTTGGRWITGGVVVPASSGWQTLTFSLLPQALLPGDAGATNVATTLSNVAVLRIMHTPVATWQGVAVAGQMELDNIEALPEPSFALGLLAGSLVLRSLGSCRRLA